MEEESSFVSFSSEPTSAAVEATLNAADTRELLNKFTDMKGRECELKSKHANLFSLNTFSELSNEQTQEKHCHFNNYYSNNSINNNNKESSSHEHFASHTRANNKTDSNTRYACTSSQSQLPQSSHSTSFYNHHVDPFYMRRDDKLQMKQSKQANSASIQSLQQPWSNECTSSQELPLQTSRRLTVTAMPSKDKALCKTNLTTRPESSLSSSSQSESQLMTRDALVLSLPETSTVYLHSVEHLSAPNSAHDCEEHQHQHSNSNNNSNTNYRYENMKINKNSPLCSLGDENVCNSLPEWQELQDKQEQHQEQHQFSFLPLHTTIDVPVHVESCLHNTHHVSQLRHSDYAISQVTQTTNPTLTSTTFTNSNDEIDNKNKVKVPTVSDTNICSVKKEAEPMSSSSSSSSPPVIEVTTTMMSKTPSDGQLASSGYSRRLKKRPPSLFVSRVPTANNSLTSPPLECILAIHNIDNPINNTTTIHGMPHCPPSSLSSSPNSQIESSSESSSQSLHHNHHTHHNNSNVKNAVHVSFITTKSNNSSNASLVSAISPITSSTPELELVHSNHSLCINNEKNKKSEKSRSNIACDTSLINNELLEKDNGNINYAKEQEEFNICSDVTNSNPKSNNTQVNINFKNAANETKCVAAEVYVKSPIYHQERAESECSTGSALAHFATVKVPHYCQHYSLSHSFARNTCGLNSPLSTSNSFTHATESPVAHINSFTSNSHIEHSNTTTMNNKTNHKQNNVNKSNVNDNSFTSTKSSMSCTSTSPTAMQPTQQLTTVNNDNILKYKLKNEHNNWQESNKEELGIMHATRSTCTTINAIDETQKNSKTNEKSCPVENGNYNGDRVTNEAVTDQTTGRLNNFTRQVNDTITITTAKLSQSSLAIDPHYAEALATCEVYFPSTTTRPTQERLHKSEEKQEAASTQQQQQQQKNVEVEQQLQQEERFKINQQMEKESGKQYPSHRHHRNKQQQQQESRKHKRKEENKSCIKKAKPLHVRLSRDGSTLMAGEFRVNSEGCLTVHNFLLLNPHHTHNTNEPYKESSVQPLSNSVGQIAISSVVPTQNNANMIGSHDVYNMCKSSMSTLTDTMMQQCNANQTYATSDSAIGEISTQYLEGSLPSAQKLERVVINNNNNINTKSNTKSNNNVLHSVCKELPTCSEQLTNTEKEQQHQVNRSSNNIMRRENGNDQELEICRKEFTKNSNNNVVGMEKIANNESIITSLFIGKKEGDVERNETIVDDSKNIEVNNIYVSGLESSTNTNNNNNNNNKNDFGILQKGNIKGNLTIDTTIPCPVSETINKPITKAPLLRPCMPMTPVNTRNMISAAGRVAAAAAAANAIRNSYLSLPGSTSVSHHGLGLHSTTLNTNMGSSSDNLINLRGSGLTPLSPSYSPMAIPLSPDVQDIITSERYYFGQQNTMYNNNNNNNNNINNNTITKNTNNGLQAEMSKQDRKVDFQVEGNKEEQFTPLNNTIHTSPNKRHCVEDLINIHSVANNHNRRPIQHQQQQQQLYHHDEYVHSMRRVESQQAIHSTTSHLPPSFTGYENNSFTLQSASMNMPYSPITYSMDSLHFPENNTINSTLLHRRSEVREFEPLLQARKNTTMVDSHADRKQSSQYELNMSSDNNGLTQSRSSHLQRDDSFMTIAQVGELLRRNAITSCDSNKSTPKANLLQSPLTNEMLSDSITHSTDEKKMVTNTKDNELHSSNNTTISITSPVKLTSPFEEASKYTNATNVAIETKVRDNVQVAQTIWNSKECHINTIIINNNNEKSNKVSPNSENNVNDFTNKTEFVHITRSDQHRKGDNNMGELTSCNMKNVKEAIHDEEVDECDDENDVVLSHLQNTNVNSNSATAAQSLLPYVELQHQQQLLQQEMYNDPQSADACINNDNIKSNNNSNNHKNKMIISQLETCASGFENPCQRIKSTSNLTMKHIALPSNVVRYKDLIITNPVGEGASASVFLAIHKPTRRRLAVKRVNLEPLCLDSNLTWGNHQGRLFRGACESARSRELRQIVIRELQVLHLSYRSPFMVKVYNAFYLPDVSALDIVMEFMHYGSIDHLAENLMRHAKQLELEEERKRKELVELHESKNVKIVAHDETCEKESNEEKEKYHIVGSLNENTKDKQYLTEQCTNEKLENSPEQEISLPQSFQSNDTLMCSSASSPSAPILTTQALLQIESQKDINSTNLNNNINSISANSSRSSNNIIISGHKENNNSNRNKGESKHEIGVNNIISSFSFSYSSSLDDVDEKGSVEEVNGVAERVVAVVGEQLLRGVRDMHDRGYIHRDIKPGNVLVNEYGVVKLSDFGLSRRCVPSQHSSKDEEVLYSDNDDDDDDSVNEKDEDEERVEDIDRYEHVKAQHEQHMFVSSYATNVLQQQLKQKEGNRANSISYTKNDNNDDYYDDNGSKADCFRGLPLSMAERHSYDARNAITKSRKHGQHYNNTELSNKKTANTTENINEQEEYPSCHVHHAKSTSKQSKKLLLQEDASEKEVSDLSSPSSLSLEEYELVSDECNGENKKEKSTTYSENDNDDNDEEEQEEEEEYIEEELQCSGTLNYMSPERLRGEPHGKASDIWAVGVTLAEFALGTYPYNLENVADIFDRMQRMEKPVECEPHNSRRKRPLSETFQDFVHLATLPIASQRPTAQELLEHPFFKQ